MKAIFQDNQITGIDSLYSAVSVGTAAAKCSPRIAVGKNSDLSGFEYAVCSGLISSGANIITLGKCLETELFFASCLAACDLCIYLKHEPLLKIDVRSKGGLPLLAENAKLLSKSLNKTTISENLSKEGIITKCSGFKEIYRQYIEKMLPENCLYSIYISCSGTAGQKIHFPKTNGEELIISLSSDGTKASFYSDRSGFISWETLVFLCCLENFESKVNCALPFEFPFSIEETATEKECRIFRYFAMSDGYSDSYARKLAMEQKFTLDGLFLAMKVLNYLQKNNLTLSEAKKKIPEFYTKNKYIELNKDRVYELIHGKTERIITGKNSHVLMKPSVSGKGLWLKIESKSMETATELCEKIEDKLKNG